MTEELPMVIVTQVIHEWTEQVPTDESLLTLKGTHVKVRKYRRRWVKLTENPETGRFEAIADYAGVRTLFVLPIWK
jgi:hypothetical protein